MTSANDRRIAKNTAFLYAKMLLSLGIQLYSSRVVLDMLGISNYGIYNVVGGIITIISFLNGAMTGATQRFLNFEMGRGEGGNLNATFAGALKIHIAIATIMLILGETIGLWFVNTQLVIPTDRLFAANWVYQLSLIGAIMTIMQVPYMASVIAHERMDVFALLSLLNSVLKLAVALLLAFAGSFDTLIMYAWLMLGVAVSIFLSYATYARRHFPETKSFRTSSNDMIKKMIGFSGSDLFGTMCCTLNLQGVLIILNRFGGPMLNAAGGVNLTVSGALSQFGSSIISAFRPQIIKQYAAEQYGYMLRLMVNCSKFAVLLLGLISIPAIINMDYLLGIWLKEVPAHTTIFCQLTLIASLGEMIRMSLNCAIHATGRILAFSFITGSIFLIELPAMYALLLATGEPWVVYGLHIAFIAILIAVTCLILHRLMPQFQTLHFIGKGIVLPLALIAATFIVAKITAIVFEPTFIKLVVTTLVSSCVLATLTWTCGLDRATRAEARATIAAKLRRK